MFVTYFFLNVEMLQGVAKIGTFSPRRMNMCVFPIVKYKIRPHLALNYLQVVRSVQNLPSSKIQLQFKIYSDRFYLIMLNFYQSFKISSQNTIKLSKKLFSSVTEKRINNFNNKFPRTFRKIHRNVQRINRWKKIQNTKLKLNRKFNISNVNIFI